MNRLLEPLSPTACVQSPSGVVCTSMHHQPFPALWHHALDLGIRPAEQLQIVIFAARNIRPKNVEALCLHHRRSILPGRSPRLSHEGMASVIAEKLLASPHSHLLTVINKCLRFLFLLSINLSVGIRVFSNVFRENWTKLLRVARQSTEFRCGVASRSIILERHRSVSRHQQRP